MAFLHFGGDGASARGAFHKAEKSEIMPLRLNRLAALCAHLLAEVKKFLRDKRFVASLVQFSAIPHKAVIEGVG
ncbi:MAG: hypothetical protein M1361_01850 [Patescibacteria group bacterium]|nr:hypothetical protein [Patescibacteria group bacterium]